MNVKEREGTSVSFLPAKALTQIVAQSRKQSGFTHDGAGFERKIVLIQLPKSKRALAEEALAEECSSLRVVANFEHLELQGAFGHINFRHFANFFTE